MTNTSIKFVGLVWKNINKKGFYLDNSCGGFVIKGKGTIAATITGECEEENIYLQVFVDRKPYKIIEVINGKNDYNLCDNLEELKEIKVLKITEAQYGAIEINDIKGACVDFDKENENQILFIGDSLTCGYGVSSGEEQYFSTKFENSLKSYAYITADDLGMEPVILAESGNGIISRYVDLDSEKPNTNSLMTESIIFMDKYIRKYFDGDFYLCHTLNPKYVIINLGTNDASYIRNTISKKAFFKYEFTNFIKKLKGLYPMADICVAYGMMDNTLTEIQREACNKVNVRFIALPKSTDNIWDGHPTEKSHEMVGHFLSSQLRKK